LNPGERFGLDQSHCVGDPTNGGLTPSATVTSVDRYEFLDTQACANLRCQLFGITDNADRVFVCR
jgi:hypothetical protein